MSYYSEDMRSKGRFSSPGRFTQTRGATPDNNLLLAQQLYAQQQLRGINATMPRNGQRRMTAGPPGDTFMEMERMRRSIKSLQDQLALADETILKLKMSKENASPRDTNELENQIQMSGKFENLSQGATRPTQIIERYEILYTQGRMDAMDDLDQISGLSKYGKHQEMKQKILYGIMVASYKVAYDYLIQLKGNICRLMGIPDKHPPSSKDVYGEATTFLTMYFQSTTQTFKIDPIVHDVQDQLIQLLPEFPSLSKLPGISAYTAECCKVAWAMVNQIPPMEMEHSQDKFSPSLHTRFHSSSEKNSKIKMYVWPSIIDAVSKDVLYKGVVWT